MRRDSCSLGTRGGESAPMAQQVHVELELGPRRSGGEPTEDLRNLPTRLFDGVLLAAAALPEHLRRRLEAAFDAALDEDPLEV